MAFSRTGRRIVAWVVVITLAWAVVAWVMS